MEDELSKKSVIPLSGYVRILCMFAPLKNKDENAGDSLAYDFANS